MRPLPRLLAYANDRIAALDDLGVRAAAIAAAGPAVALVARLPGGSADQLAALAQRFVANATPPMALVLVTGRGDIATATGAQGAILRQHDLDVATVRRMLGTGRDDMIVFSSVHSVGEAEAAIAGGTDALIVGTIWNSTSHTDRPAAGTALLEAIVALGVPTYAIGGVTPARAVEARALGAWGVAAISAVWDAEAPYRAAREIVKPWTDWPCS